MATTSSPIPGAPELDRHSDPWVGSFPGLGTVRVAADGGATVEVQSDCPESAEKRERALRYGWGEPLSFVRRGFACPLGAAVSPPDSHDSCLLLHADPDDAAVLMIPLSLRGWSIMCDRTIPTRWEGDALVAHHREAPLLVSRYRADNANLPGKPVRDDTDSVEINLPRSVGPRRVAAIVALERRKPDETAFEQLSGQERFKVVAALVAQSVLAPIQNPSNAQDPDRALAEHLRWAAIPLARLRFDSSTITIDVDTLAVWWRSVAGERAGDPR